MAERRMFSKAIIDSDMFLDMPLTAQALYFHMSMRADDDGFVDNPKKIQRMVGASDDDFKLLIAKQFLIVFDNGIIVIKHWKIHNYIQKDRYKPTIYQNERAQLYEEKNKMYTLCKPTENELETECIQDVSKMDTQSRLDKSRLERDENVYTKNTHAPKYGKYENVILDDNELDKLKQEFPVDWEERIEYLSEYMASTGKKYPGHLATIRRWAAEDEKKQSKQAQQKKQSRKSKFNNYTDTNTIDYDALEEQMLDMMLDDT